MRPARSSSRSMPLNGVSCWSDSPCAAAGPRSQRSETTLNPTPIGAAVRLASIYRHFLPLAIVGAVASALLLVPFPDFTSQRLRPALFNGIENLGHPLLFAILALLGQSAARQHDRHVQPRYVRWLAAGLL